MNNEENLQQQKPQGHLTDLERWRNLCHALAEDALRDDYAAPPPHAVNAVVEDKAVTHDIPIAFRFNVSGVRALLYGALVAPFAPFSSLSAAAAAFLVKAKIISNNAPKKPVDDIRPKDRKT